MSVATKTIHPMPTPVAERPIEAVRGTRDWLPGDSVRLQELQALLLDRFARAGYRRMRTPVLEFTELHERKSGAGIVAKLFELAGMAAPAQGGVCLRPELTAGIVRAYTDAAEPPSLPWRVSHAGPVFRHENLRPDRLREFHQVGVERLGDAGPYADAELIWLADWGLAEAGIDDATIRVGHVGLILEMLQRSGLPGPLASALIETLERGGDRGAGNRRPRIGAGAARGLAPASGSGADAPGGGRGRRRCSARDRAERSRDRPPLPHAGAGDHRPSAGRRDRGASASEVGPGARSARRARRRPTAGPGPGRSERAGPGDARLARSATTSRSLPIRSRRFAAGLRRWSIMAWTSIGWCSTSGSAGESGSTRG